MTNMRFLFFKKIRSFFGRQTPTPTPRRRPKNDRILCSLNHKDAAFFTGRIGLRACGARCYLELQGVQT